MENVHYSNDFVDYLKKIETTMAVVHIYSIRFRKCSYWRRMRYLFSSLKKNNPLFCV